MAKSSKEEICLYIPPWEQTEEYLSDIEEDGLFIPNNDETKYPINEEPDNPKEEHKDMRESVISLRVVHPAADDSKLGDDFGAKLASTSYTFKGRHQWQHTFKNIQAGSVAGVLNLRAEVDELVLMNNQFLPNLENEEVALKFHNLPVDGTTELTMVVRRREENAKRFWISIRFVLSSEAVCKEPKIHVSGQPHEDRLQTDPETEPYKIKLKMADDFLCVENESICIRKLNESNDPGSELFIMKRSVVDTDRDKPGYQFLAALEAPGHSRKYIGPDQHLHIKLLDQEAWYNYEFDGNYFSFIHKDKLGRKFYLARQEDKPVLLCTEFKCQVFPVPPKKVAETDSGYNSSS